MPTRDLLSGAARPTAYNWKDVTPRMGAAYDLFGNGKTAVKFNLGKYMEAFTATNSDLDLNPLIRTTISTTRTWTDTNKDFVPNCDLAQHRRRTANAAAMDNQNLGQGGVHPDLRPRASSPAGASGRTTGAWASRSSRKSLPRVSVNVGYFRNWWGNWYTVDNRSTTLADYTPFSIPAPVDPRLPDGGGYTIGGLYNLVPSKVGQVDELAQSSSNFGEQTENWHGVDVNVVARLRNGLTVQGGTSTGRRLSDACALKAALPEQGTGRRRREHLDRRRQSPVEPVLPRRRAVPDRVQGARDVHDSRRWTSR